jgi:hypothetical protein
MSQQDDTHFHFDFGGITLELSGERQFVEKMYRQIMKDVEQARAQRIEKPEVRAAQVQRINHAVWVHRCSEMMRKIYMTTQGDIERTILGRCLDPEELAVVYVDKDILSNIFPEFDKGQTLWAEFTPAGREKIAEVTSPMRQVLELPQK